MTSVFEVRPITVWPEGWRDPARKRGRSQFRSSYTDTTTVLRYELEQLDAEGVFIQLDVRPEQIRQDGRLRAGVRAGHPGVILTAQTAKGPLVLACDRFYDGASLAWQTNLRAIALGLKALRQVDRYGIGGGQQYAGYRALPVSSTAALGPGQTATMTAETAANVLARWAHREAADILTDPTTRGDAILATTRRLHPDSGRDYTPEAWAEFLSARAALESL